MVVLTPEECLHLAASRNLKGLAITDHDTIDGYLQIRDQVIYPDLELLAGVEISCNYEGREIHMLAYGFDADQQELRDFMAQQRHVRRKRTRQIIERLAALGFDISFSMKLWLNPEEPPSAGTTLLMPCCKKSLCGQSKRGL